MKKYFLILIISFFVLAPSLYAKVSDSTGFLSSQIWYSKNELVEGETVKIYTAVWNGNDKPLSVKVEFYDRNVILGTRDVVVPVETLEDVSISWKVTSGDHYFSAKILSSVLNIDNSKKENVVLENNKTSSNKVFVPVIVKKEDGEISKSSDVAKDELIKVGEKINDIIPESVAVPLNEGLVSVDIFRIQTLSKIAESKEKAEEKLLTLEDFSDNEEEIRKAKTLEEATEKPITNVKLFFLKILEFIFSHKLVFYGLIIFFIFYFLRGVYRKIRNR